MAGEINLGNVVGLVKSPTAPAKKYVIWSKEIAPGVEIKLLYNYETDTWDPLNAGNPYFQNPVKTFGVNDPPAGPASGDRYVIGTVPTGAWTGHGRYIAQWNGVDWQYTPPLTTMQVASTAEPGKLYIFDGIDWIQFSSGAGSELIAFNGNRPITRNIPGLFGVTPGGTNLVEFTENTYYTALNPGITLSIRNGNSREMGASNAVLLDWSVTKTTNNITGITINGVPITPNGGNQSGTLATTATQNGTTAFSASVQAGAQSASTSQTLTYYHKRFFFTSAQDLYNMTEEEITAVLNGLTNSGTTRFEYATGKDWVSPGKNFYPAEEFVYYCYLNSYGLATFVINNQPNTDFQTKSFAYVNVQGASATFRLFRTTYLQNGAFLIDAN